MIMCDVEPMKNALFGHIIRFCNVSFKVNPAIKIRVILNLRNIFFLMQM